ncbi:haloacid dehalogenase [Phanerochaete sordida]|uniref:Haloacid dehalogenase n=1 Tax=Phanerochaete sordida TaxID=48140 RepID=A0A9P3G540_9APHY|nr:haloacid dehalogenase [Phanerochaete sordida]
MTHPLADVEVFLFDVFGTVVDWQNSVAHELQSKHYDGILELDWIAFAQEWRRGYIVNTKRIAEGGEGPRNIDALHRQILDGMLAKPEWEALGRMWGEEKRREVNLVWHRLKGWPDTTPGLYALKKHAIIGTLSNGNVRLLVDMAKHADLLWDVVFSGELLGSYKPNPQVYTSALTHLSLAHTPHKVALVAAHIYDLRAAAALGYTTVYVPRATEDIDMRDELKRHDVRDKASGGEVDVLVGSFEELARVVGEVKA